MSDQDDAPEGGAELLRQVAWQEIDDLADLDGGDILGEAPAPGADAEPDDDAPEVQDDKPPGDDGYDVVRIPRGLRARLTLPPGCPVTPLGIVDDRCFYLDSIGQLRRVPADKHGQNTLKSLFGDTAYLIQHWPRAKEDGEGGWVATGWKPEECGSALIDSCMKRGVFDPDTKIRGAGAWKGDNGELIVHFGKCIGVWSADGGDPDWFQPCELGDWIYPTRSLTLPLPARQAETAIGAAQEVLAYLRSWNWARPDVDPWLLLGFIVACYLGAALKWHPLFWAVGDRGTGKSTLLLLIHCLLGGFMLKIENATAAYIYQKVAKDSRAVGIDEAEPDEEGTRLKQQQELARAAASGSSIGRGGADGTPVEFYQRAPWMFCSINVPGLNSADMSRIAMGVLGKLDGHVLPSGALVPPEEDEVAMRKVMEPLGRRLLRRILGNWHRYSALLRAYRGAMKDGGHVGRGADLFGTQLALAHLVLYDHPPTPAELADWARKMKASDLAELSNDLPTNRACLLHLQTSLLDAKRSGQSYTAGYWIQKLYENKEITDGNLSAAKDVREVLRAHGLDVKPAPQPAKNSDKPPPPPGLYLWVANRHRGVAGIFADSPWRTRPGTAGPWTRQLASLDGAIANVSFFVDGAQDKAVLIPIHYCQECPPGPQGEHGAPSAPGDQTAAGRSPAPPSAPDPSGGHASARSAAVTAQPSPSPYPSDPDPFALDDPL